jgi:CheY-like chemotaxis protein
LELSPSPAAPDPRHLLLVIRDDGARHLYAEYFRTASAEEVLEADDAPDALAKAISRPPDVIVTETQLAAFDGHELCALLRRDPATCLVPIIVLTEDTSLIGLRRARKAGADAVLKKPCPPELLLREIRVVVQRSRMLRQRAAEIRERLDGQLKRSRALQERSTEHRHKLLSRTFQRETTMAPDALPPVLVCPECDRMLVYKRTYLGGVSERYREQWDYLACPGSCGTFQYRHRTRALRKVS